MLITMLRGRRRKATEKGTARKAPRTRQALDLSGPLPAVPSTPVRPDAHPYREGALVAGSLRPTTWQRGATPLSRLPREVDPFESDFPWIGWTEPRHESFVRSELRSPTFERDLQRVLSILSN
jgi:hypothetical protein